MGWINYIDEKPRHGQNIIAVGTWRGEIGGCGEDGYMGIGEYCGDGLVSIDSDTYSTEIINVTHWMPIPKHP